MHAAYPLLLDLSDRLIVIVGGGAVAARKASGVIDAGARRVHVVAPDFRGQFPASVERVMSAYQPEHLDGAGLVFAATDSAEVNSQVVRDARARGVLVCRADATDDHDDASGDFLTPAIFRDGPLTVCVSAGSAALAALIRDELRARLDPGWLQMAREMQILRPFLVRASQISNDVRRDALRTLATRDAMEILRSGGAPALRAWLGKRHPTLTTILEASNAPTC